MGCCNSNNCSDEQIIPLTEPEKKGHNSSLNLFPTRTIPLLEGEMTAFKSVDEISDSSSPIEKELLDQLMITSSYHSERSDSDYDEGGISGELDSSFDEDN